jgi:enolase
MRGRQCWPLGEGIRKGIANSILVQVNQLLRIEEQLGTQARYAGTSVLRGWR